jgi:hypothetical protein
MALEQTHAVPMLKEILADIANDDGTARVDYFSSLRAVDAKVREARMILETAGATSLIEALDRDSDFEANSRRIRLEALANLCRTAIKFFQSGALKPQKTVVAGPDLTKITSVMPDLEAIIQARWKEAQRCQYAKAYLAAVIVMGSILEALLLSRCSMAPSSAYQSRFAPKDRSGNSVAIHHWTLSTLIDVSVDCGWLKSDRGQFSHALRHSRNVVHPYEHARTNAEFDEATCKVCWQVLNASVEDLLTTA